MTDLSAEQLAIVGAPLEPMSVVACAGSGKTRTAVERLADIRRKIGAIRGRVALLSFSNVAVDTLRKSYQTLLQGGRPIGRDRVDIDTMDGFITSYVLRPHAYRTMGCERTPFLIVGTEPFLRNKEFMFWVQSTSAEDFPVQPVNLDDVVVNIKANEPNFHYRQYANLLPIKNGSAVASRLGRVGAYTHDLGRYWCYQTLVTQPGIARALVRRYPHILVDEAQDIGTLHQAILELLIQAGAQVTLIGDPNQGIYEFTGADGSFLKNYEKRQGVKTAGLTRNYRSVPSILDLANNLATRKDEPDRVAPTTTHGTFFIGYKDSEREQLISAFQVAVLTAELSVERSAVLCRARALADKLAGNDSTNGQGMVKGFARAAVLRDQQQDYHGAFKLVVACVVGLLADPPKGIVAMIMQPGHHPELRPLRRLIWEFTRDAALGLPAATLVADTTWHSQLRKRTIEFLSAIQNTFGLTTADNLGNKLAKKGLPNVPLMISRDLANAQNAIMRIETVHQVKGESLDAVLYLTEKSHVTALLAGVNTELGRIGYVAVTRARNLLWLGVPHSALKELRPALLASGFRDAREVI